MPRKFRLEFESSSPLADRLIAQLLKVALRRFQLRCTRVLEVGEGGPPADASVPERARHHAAQLLLCYVDAADTGEREAVAAAVARLTPHGARPLAEQAQEALAAARPDDETPRESGPQDAFQAAPPMESLT